VEVVTSRDGVSGVSGKTPGLARPLETEPLIPTDQGFLLGQHRHLHRQGPERVRGPLLGLGQQAPTDTAALLLGLDGKGSEPRHTVTTILQVATGNYAVTVIKDK